MQGVKGVVVGSGRVRLSSGRIVSVPRVTGIKRYDVVIVHWDYRYNEPIRMVPYNPNEELLEDSVQPETLQYEGDEPDEDTDLLDTGALIPSFDGAGASGASGFWHLVLSDGSLAGGGVE